MKNVMSVRLDAENIRRIRQLAKRDKKEISTVARELMNYGWVFLLLREYRQRKISLGTLARQLGISLSETIDLLADWGVKSPLDYEDYLKSYAAAADFIR